MAEYTKDKEYRRTSTFKSFDSATKKLWEQYKTKNEISDEHMAEIFKLQDLRNLPKEEKQKGNRIPESLLVVTILFFVFQMNGQNQVTMTMIVTAVMVIFSAILYLTGALNPVSTAIRKSKKKLKKNYPKVPSFDEWCAQNEIETASKKKEDAREDKE